MNLQEWATQYDSPIEPIGPPDEGMVRVTIPYDDIEACRAACKLADYDVHRAHGREVYLCKRAVAHTQRLFYFQPMNAEQQADLRDLNGTRWNGCGGLESNYEDDRLTQLAFMLYGMADDQDNISETDTTAAPVVSFSIS